MELDHINQRADGGDNSKENAIPVCFECHAEIHSYNDKHPRGRKFRPGELQKHKQQWLKLCTEKPAMLLNANRSNDVGPLQALIDELEYNAALASLSLKEDGNIDIPPFFVDDQFRSCIREGSIAILKEELKNAILAAYATMALTNQHSTVASNQDFDTHRMNCTAQLAQRARVSAREKISKAIENLMSFLQSE